MAEWVRRPLCGMGDELLARIPSVLAGNLPPLVPGKHPPGLTIGLRKSSKLVQNLNGGELMPEMS